jgi:apolipoprotein N-acyltransferase
VTVTVTQTVPPVESPPAAVSRARSAGFRLSRLLGAVLAGVALLVAFPPYGLWWAAPVGVALLAVSVHGRRVRAGFGLGVVTGAVFFTPLLAWTNLHTGMLPWLLLSGLEALYIGLLGAAAAFAAPLVERWRWAAAPLVGVLWTAQEALRDRTPFGGFPWGRLAFSQGDSPLLPLAAVGGAPLVTFAVALCGGLLAALLLPGWRPRVAHVAALAVAIVGAWVIPLTPPRGTPVTVAIVQGNVPRLGLDFNEQRRAVLDNHARATIELANRVAAGQANQPALVIWPENSSDIDPLRNADAGKVIDDAARAIKAPILVGAVLVTPAGGVENAGLVWQAGQGVTDRYVKRHPVPFAEYVPLRRIARMVSAEVDRVSSDFVAGDEPGVLRVGPATVGDVICFEVAYDDIVRDTVTGGAQLLAVQTNNATFDPAEAAQQLAMVRLRAVEHGRDALMASTVGISGFVDAEGRVHGATTFNTQEVVVRELRLSTARTLATRLGEVPEVALVSAAVAALVLTGWLRRRRWVSARAAAGSEETTNKKTEGSA